MKDANPEEGQKLKSLGSILTNNDKCDAKIQRRIWVAKFSLSLEILTKNIKQMNNRKTKRLV